MGQEKVQFRYLLGIIPLEGSVMVTKIKLIKQTLIWHNKIICTSENNIIEDTILNIFFLDNLNDKTLKK